VCACTGFLDRLRIELRLQGQLQGLGLKPGLVQQLLKQRATSNAEVEDLRLDLSPMKQVGRKRTRLAAVAHRPGSFVLKSLLPAAALDS
jgi:hypothetical protein